MTEEEKSAKEAEEAEFQASLSELSDEEKEQKIAERADSSSQIDYDAELKAERERADNAEKALAKRRFEESEARRKASEDGGEEKPLTARELETILTREREVTQKELQTVRALEIARANTSSEAEAQAVLAFWKNRVIPTGNLEEDVRFAVGGLNHKKVVSRNAELARALKSRDMVSDDTMGTHRDSPEGSEPKLSAEDASAYKGAGFEWDGKLRLYKKPINKGKKHILKDPKSGRSWVQ